jgi:hypothetical protein
MNRNVPIVVGILVACILAAQPTSALQTGLDALNGTGVISKSELLAAFGSDDSKWLETNANEITFRRDGAESWNVTCLPVSGEPYVEEYVRTFHVYADPIVNRKSNGKVSSMTLNGWTTIQTFDNPDISALVTCANGDPISKPTWRYGSRGWRNYWDAPNVMPVFNYQHTSLVATVNGVDSVVLATYP